MFIIRFAFYFVLSFAILCIPAGNNQQLFDKIFSLVAPVARDTIKTTKQKITSTGRYSKKLFSNSAPTDEQDEVKSKMAGITRTKNKVKVENKAPEDTYTEEEQERLRRVLSEE